MTTSTIHDARSATAAADHRRHRPHRAPLPTARGRPQLASATTRRSLMSPASSTSTSPATRTRVRPPARTRPARAFQLTVWEQLREIPYGETISYGAAGASGSASPNASRAVGLANGRNPISIVMPCHRVIGADGSLTGYGGGLDRKRFLLGLEVGADRLL